MTICRGQVKEISVRMLAVDKAVNATVPVDNAVDAFVQEHRFL